MRLKARAARLVRWLVKVSWRRMGHPGHAAIAEPDQPAAVPIGIDALDAVVAAFLRNDRAAWENRTLALPDWFNDRLDPAGLPYRAQMLRLWEAITGRNSYDPGVDEDTPEIGELDAIYRPAFYASNDLAFAGKQIMATGHILMRSDVRPGDRVLEYGAGFGQTALAFARMGVTVDTVDINPAFCRAVQNSADHFQVDLNAHHGRFGDNPAYTAQAYDLILFYESFHHCLDFSMLIPKLSLLLKPGGSVILAGEPIFEKACADLPYPWGIRLEWQNVAVMRLRGWMELGFQEKFLQEKFEAAGFELTTYSDDNSHWARIHQFRRRPESPSHGDFMNMRAGVVWAYRLFLNREPDSQELDSLSLAESPAKLRSIMTASQQFKSMLDRAGRLFQPSMPVDFREGVIWGFRLLLQREPSPQEILDLLKPDDTIAALRLRFTTTREFELHAGDALPLLDFAVVNAFAPFKKPEPIDGSCRDFLGNMTSVQYFPQELHNLSRRADNSIPRPSAPHLHGTAEWVGTLRSIIEAGDRFTAVELGAGWGPWLVVSAAAARVRGIADVRLVGVEASAEHFGFMRHNFEANGLDPNKSELHRAIIAPTDGWAEFPKLHVASEDYGANAVFDFSEKDRAALRGELERVQAISLTSLLSKHDRVDLIHIDIQGHEEDVLRSALPLLNERVRRMVVSTHSRAIEGHLLELLSDEGWICEFELPCRLQWVGEGRPIVIVDGEQVWRNTRVPALN
jgi:FkbM family methyltransferase